MSSIAQEKRFTYGTYSSDHGVNLLGAAAVVHQLLFEEEVNFSIVGVSAIGNEMSTHKSGL